MVIIFIYMLIYLKNSVHTVHYKLFEILKNFSTMFRNIIGTLK